MTQQVLIILGSTGSIGVNTLDVISRHPEKFHVFTLVGHRQVKELAAQYAQSAPEYAVVTDAEHAVWLETLLEAQNSGIRVLHGTRALADVTSADEIDDVIYTIVDAAGLPSALAAMQKGKTICLANKGTPVVSGALFMETARTSNARILPVDSEHNTIFQVLPHNYTSRPNKHDIRSIILTASGGPFPDADLAGFEHVAPARTVKHPNWSTGRKISINPATMMNKGPELVEAHWLFNCPPDDLKVVIHPQSVVHSMVRYLGGSILAQFGNPDIRTPIAYCLGPPKWIEPGMNALSFDTLSALTFRRPDFGRFPCLGLACDAMCVDGSAPYILNVANEMAVAVFLDGRIRFTDIAHVVTHCLDAGFSDGPNDIEGLPALDTQTRVRAQEYAENLN